MQITTTTDSVTRIRTFDENGRQTGIEIIHPKDAECAMDVEGKLHKSNRTYWNPATESMVSYARARQLGINTEIEPEIHC